MSKLTIAKLDRYDLINNPMGKKPSFTIWFSGCHFHCKGCQNRALWDREAGVEFSANTLFDIINKECIKLNIQDVVLLGGEPLDQFTNPFCDLLALLYRGGYKIWLYTGYEFEDIHPAIKQYLYTIKCGRYDENKLSDESFPITTNQRVFRNAGGWKQINIKEDMQ